MNFLEVAGSRTIFDSLDITEGTKQDYLARLPYFLGFANRDGITRDLLLNYKKHLRSRTDLGVASKNKYLAVARLTMKELYRQGYISIDLSLNVKSFQQSTAHKVQGLNDNEVQRICNYLRDADNSLKTVRLRALVALLIFQGLRQIEVCRLDVGDIDVTNGVIKVRGKGRDDKDTLYLHPQTVKALSAYLRRSQVKDGPLFTPLLRHRLGERLSTRGLRAIIQALFGELNIDRTVHGTRHYYTTQLIRNYKSDLTAVAKYTRHSSLEMLRVYNDALLNKRDLPRYYATFSMELVTE